MKSIANHFLTVRANIVSRELICCRKKRAEQKLVVFFHNHCCGSYRWVLVVSLLLFSEKNYGKVKTLNCWLFIKQNCKIFLHYCLNFRGPWLFPQEPFVSHSKYSRQNHKVSKKAKVIANKEAAIIVKIVKFFAEIRAEFGFFWMPGCCMVGAWNVTTDSRWLWFVAECGFDDELKTSAFGSDEINPSRGNDVMLWSNKAMSKLKQTLWFNAVI